MDKFQVKYTDYKIVHLNNKNELRVHDAYSIIAQKHALSAKALINK